MAASTTTPPTDVTYAPQAVFPRQVITQTLTYPDYTTTAVVTLGAGDPAAVPPASPNDAQDAHSLPSSNAGIITGSIVGAIVLALLIWVGCIVRRRIIEAEIYEHERERESAAAAYYAVQEPARTYWPRFPMSIPPPDVPTYRATTPRSMYTANEAVDMDTTSYDIYDVHRRRR